MLGDTVIIKNSKDLLILLDRPMLQDFKFDFEGLDASETQRWLEEIRRDYFSCGCDTGAIYMTTSAIIVAIFFLALYLAGLPILTYTNILCSAFFIFLAAGVGKFIGLGVARHRLRKNIQQLSMVLLSEAKCTRVTSNGR
jgi:hypothetical protein